MVHRMSAHYWHGDDYLQKSFGECTKRGMVNFFIDTFVQMNHFVYWYEVIRFAVLQKL